jgi:hypothetical protein
MRLRETWAALRASLSSYRYQRRNIRLLSSNCVPSHTAELSSRHFTFVLLPSMSFREEWLALFWVSSIATLRRNCFPSAAIDVIRYTKYRPASLYHFFRLCFISVASSVINLINGFSLSLLFSPLFPPPPKRGGGGGGDIYNGLR